MDVNRLNEDKKQITFFSIIIYEYVKITITKATSKQVRLELKRFKKKAFLKILLNKFKSPHL